MRRMAILALGIALLAECGGMIWARSHGHANWGHLMQPLIFTAIFAALAVSRGRVPWITTVARLLLAYEFGMAVADRFGWLGPPGSGAGWGDFAHFVAYTRHVNAFLPASFAYSLAVLATIGESVFAFLLALGLWLRWGAAGAAVLLLLFASAMTASGLSAGQFSYAVFVLAAGAWVIAVSEPSWLSVDRWLWKRRAAETALT